MNFIRPEKHFKFRKDIISAAGRRPVDKNIHPGFSPLSLSSRKTVLQRENPLALTVRNKIINSNQGKITYNWKLPYSTIHRYIAQSDQERIFYFYFPIELELESCIKCKQAMHVFVQQKHAKAHIILKRFLSSWPGGHHGYSSLDSRTDAQHRLNGYP
ncbi:hypothetical protein T310_7742 [Rasamsonia emersonii CBS 393.64]|uniref:Uncharacterized protein n=1 Tax=Rasamsonia emersonii (strain ATCC 16479 / CBS 393.64 / IMI 116815) TaxID=1408163 RepID=A0A0F4YL36_RASE3|nr:hypothetical protein T310_7742 [Rasamsonia emersonii CBS 393.64]KKA18303.1 hypothetical protein T310_7742 [Rasamsonia emersonii CBS 393.64]